MSDTAHVRLLYEDQVPPLVFDDFRKAVATDGFSLSVNARPKSGSFAGLE
jgi:hypothetical protein